eukprot:4991294-Prymnesium_polylepis.1
MLHTGGRAACCTRECGRRAGGGACHAPGGTRAAGHSEACACAADNGGDSHVACLLYSKDVDTPARS